MSILNNQRGQNVIIKSLRDKINMFVDRFEELKANLKQTRYETDEKDLQGNIFMFQMLIKKFFFK